MESRRSLLFMRILAAIMVVSLGAATAVALDSDPDPNSPTPVLLSYSTSTRALAVEGPAPKRIDLNAVPERPFLSDSTITLFVGNLRLMEGEGANAFRIYAQDAEGHFYRFPVLSIEPMRHGARGMYAITCRLTDQIGYWSRPQANGDLLLQLTWRGLGSNRVRLGLGRIGGGPLDDAGAMPTPPGTMDARSTKTQGGATPDTIGYRWSGDRMRFLEQATFGPSPALDHRVRRIGLRTWLAEQLTAQYPSVNNPYPNFPLRSDNPEDTITGCGMFPDGSPEEQLCIRDHYGQYQTSTWFFREGYYGEPQLRHRVAWALGQIWVTSAIDIQQGRHMVEYHKVLSNNAFGNYRNLMKEMTLNPAMGEYLSMRLSTRNNPNENYAREIMQLFTIGLFLLNQDGTLKLDGQGQPIPTYDQNGVNNLTKVFTGWNLCNNAANPLCDSFVAGTQNYIDPMILVNRNNHDLTAKTLLSWPADPNFPPNNTNIPACTGCTGTAIDAYAALSMDQALDNMYAHPNVAPFVCRTLIQHLVTSDPTPAYVERVATVFNANRTNPTQMKEVVRAILLDPEARGDVKTDPFYGKLREPVLFATNFLRAFGVRSADGAGLSEGYIAMAGAGANGRGEFNGMAQVPFFAPTVFNYFPPDYVVPGTTMNGPEFAILTTGTSIQRTNFINRFTYTAIPIPVAPPNAPNGTSVDFSDLQALVAQDTTGGLLLDELNHRMLHNTMTPEMKNTIMTAIAAVNLSNPPTNEQLLNRTRAGIYLVATSSQYQVQR